MSIERNPLNSFTRGGQFLNHFLRMAKANIAQYLATALIVGGGFGYWKWTATADRHDQLVLYQEATYAAVLLMHPTSQKEVVLARADGSQVIRPIADRHLDEQWTQDVARSHTLFAGALRYALLLAALVLFIAMGAAMMIGRAFATDKHQRGARLDSSRDVAKAIKRHNSSEKRKTGMRDYTSYDIAGVEYPLRGETQHTMLAGSTGSGKTQMLARIIEQIRKRCDRAIIYDKMRSFIERFFDPSRDIILNPLDARCACVNIFLDARNLVDWENYARAIIPDSTDGDPFWVTTARSVFAHTANRYQRNCSADGKDPTIRGLLHLITQTSHEQLHKFLRGTPAAVHIDPENVRTTASIRVHIADGIRSLGYLRDPEPGERGVSLREWVRNEDGDGFIFLTSREDMHPVLQPLITMWLTVLVSELMSQPRSNQRLLWFLLDELPSLYRLPGLERALAEARQYGAAYVIGIQLVSQLRDTYGREGANTIMGLTRNKVVFNPGDPDTAKIMSEFIGQKEILRREHGISIGANTIRDGQSVSSRVTMQAIILPEELLQLPGLNGVVKMAGDFSACRITLEYMDLSGEQPGYVEDTAATERAVIAYERHEADPKTTSEKATPTEPPSSSAKDSTPDDGFVGYTPPRTVSLLCHPRYGITTKAFSLRVDDGHPEEAETPPGASEGNAEIIENGFAGPRSRQSLPISPMFPTRAAR